MDEVPEEPHEPLHEPEDFGVRDTHRVLAQRNLLIARGRRSDGNFEGLHVQGGSSSIFNNESDRLQSLKMDEFATDFVSDRDMDWIVPEGGTSLVFFYCKSSKVCHTRMGCNGSSGLTGGVGLLPVQMKDRLRWCQVCHPLGTLDHGPRIRHSGANLDRNARLRVPNRVPPNETLEFLAAQRRHLPLSDSD